MLIKRIHNLCSSLSGLRAGELAGAPSGNRQGRGTLVPRLVAGLRPTSGRLSRALASVAALGTLSLAAPQAWCATGDRIVNRASFSAQEITPLTSSVTVTVVNRTPSTIEFLKYAPGVSGSSSLPVATTSFLNGSGVLSGLPAPVSAGTRTAIDLSQPVALLPSGTFHQGEPIFIRVSDLDQNLDRTRAESVLITISDPKTGDSETLRLTESGPDTGVFLGYIQTSAAAAQSLDGTLSVAEASSITARYVDIVDGTDSSTTAALVDPFGIVFDSLTGQPVDGARVELLNSDGSPAAVLGDDGATGNSFPNSVLSGATASDHEGNLYVFNPGSYRFPFVAPGNYILRITPPAAYSSPSTVATTQLLALPGGFTIVNGSRGEIFSVPTGPAIRVDIPIDPRTGTLWLRKSAAKSSVAPGEFLHYDIALENTDPLGTVHAALVTDRLPAGFRYQKGSARLNGAAAADPAISPDGSTLSFTVGDIAPKASALLSYVTGVGAGAKPGSAVNIAFASTTPAVASNAASATVAVQEPFLQSRSLLMGRVVVGACSDKVEDNKKGMAGIGIYLEDGTFVISDQRGMFHFEGVHAGSHVVQLDIDSIPEGYQVLPCEQNSRFAGRAYSQFVDLQGGTMWRTDFYLGRIADKSQLTPPVAEEANLKDLSRASGTSASAAGSTAATSGAGLSVTGSATGNGGSAGPAPSAQVEGNYQGELSLEMISSQSGNFIDYRIPMQGAGVPLSNLQLTVTLPQGAIYHKGSSNLDAAPLADPAQNGQQLSYRLGSAGAGWQKELRFRVSIGRGAQGGELQTKAALSFDSPTGRGVAAPEVDNLLSLVKETAQVSLPAVVLHPQFPTFGAELSDEDRKQLDELALVLSRFRIEQIDVTGHTDIVRIAPRSRKVYADNTALSFARARSVGRYLTAALHLPPERLNLGGKGEREPVASNRSDAGRTQNRRVEVNVVLSQTVEASHLSITKDRSGLKKAQVAGAPASTTASASPGAAAAGLTRLQPQEETIAVRGAAQGVVAGNQAAAVTTAAFTTAQAAAVVPAAAMTTAQAAAAVPAAAITTAPAAAAASPAPPQQQKKKSATPPAQSEEHVELASVLSEGTVHYRVRLAGFKGQLKRVKVTLTTPKNLLYMTGTTRLSGGAASDPDTKEGVIAYTYPWLPEANKFDLRLQALIDGEDQGEAPPSSVTVEVADADGKPLKTYSATAELSDNLDDLERKDSPAAQEAAAGPARKATEEAEQAGEYIEKLPQKGGARAEAPNHDNDMRVTEKPGVLSPADKTLIASQVNAVRIVLPSGLTPVLTLDGKEIPAERIGFKLKDRESEKTLYTYIGVDFGAAGEHTLQLKGMDSFGLARYDKTSKVFRTGEIAAIRLVSAEGNIADGRTPVQLRVELTDQEGKPVLANAELALKGGDLRPWSASGNMGRDAGASMVSVDAQGVIKFMPVSASGLYRLQLSYNKATLDIETYVKPVMRDWILVGLAEGTAGYQTATGHMENLKAAGVDEHFYDRERLAFYAKGTIKGEWLMTMSYDSAKQSTGVSGNALFQNIDPNSFYTLYGDGSAQGYDAASQKKLFLKIERDQFYALYGDFDSGLTVTELSRYSRRMNGIKTELRTKKFELTAFGSETGQSFAKDEIRGDGTSGLYRLSRKGIVINSEKITIESRDRFKSELVTDSRPMSRFIDYSIDYEAGTIFFKGPIASRDEQLNPVYIVVDYEVQSAGQDAVTLGGRAGAKLMDGKLKVGASYIHEGHVSGANNLYGADAAVELAAGTKARAEVASSNNDTSFLKSSGNAYLAEVVHTGRSLDGKAYFRQQDSGFGLGQQMGSEAGTRKFGAEGAYKLSESSALSAQAYRQYNLTGGTVRDFAEALGSYTDKQFSARAGVSYANDALADGSNHTSLLGRLGGSWKSPGQRLTLRADHEQALFGLDGNTDFPTRTILGADYQISKEITATAQDEMTYGAAANTNTIRVGLKATPWSGGTISTSVGNDSRENSDRTFATVGLAQKYQLTPAWTVDGALERSQTISQKAGYTLNANVPPASGGEDFTAISAGANYQEKKLTWSNRVEYRTSTLEKKWGLVTGVMNEQGLYWGWTGRLQVLHSRTSDGSERTDADVRMGLAYRPPVTRWILLDRLDLISNDQQGSGSTTRGKRIINNLNANFKPDQRSQLSLQYGAKYVLETIDDADYSGYTDLIGAEGRYDLTKEWDIGLRGSILHTWELHQMSYSLGASVGYNLMENGWLSLGYNLLGFKDRDFSAANFTSQGPYVQFRVKFDQNSVKDGLKVLNL
jgi:uncharacterized repeat protein (TIGR01451 family)